MKVSFKVREERRPIVRAKLPLNVMGLPVFTGVTSGDQEELALHLGTDVQAGPSFRVSYKPNNSFSPFSVLVKTGFGLWGSPNGAALAMSAEFDLNNSSGSPSFSIRLKPKFGDFGLRKDSGRFKASYENVAKISGGRRGDKMIMEDSGGPSMSDHADVALDELEPVSPIANGDLHAKSLADTDAGAFAVEKAESFGSSALEVSASLEKPRDTTPEKVKRINDPSPSEDEGARHEQQVAQSISNAVVVRRRGGESASTVGGVNTRLEAAAKGWRFNAHSALPLGGWAVAKVRWQVKFASEFIHDVRQGMHITDIKLPALAVDKVSFQTLNRPTKRRPSTELVDFTGLGYGCDDNSQLGRIAAMCTSMRYQIQLLHLENKLLKNTIDEWRGDLPAIRRSPGKGTELILQEDSAFRSQMFDELNGKLSGSSSGSGKSNGNGKSRDGRYSGDSQTAPRTNNGKGTTSSGEEFSLSKDPSEELQKAILNATGGGH